MSPVVIKLGGSLLSLPDLAARFKRVVSRRTDGPFALVVGGGAAADLVREWDRLHRLGDEAAHQLALCAMRLNSELVAGLFPELRPVTNLRELSAETNCGRPVLVDAAAWLTAAEAAGRPAVPRNWDATSDSIAAWLASELSAAELVLLKSVPRPDGDVAQAAADGLVDAWFPSAAAGVPRISWGNLRSDDCPVEGWILNGKICDGEHRS